MLMPQRALPKVLGAFLVASTIAAVIPQAALADPTRATVNENTDAKGPKKTKRKKTTTAWSGMSVRRLHGSPWMRRPHRTPAEIAVASARAQIGKPYRWGAAGPSGFDCSGLTRYAWGQAGVHLPHSSRGQYASLRHVSLDELKPGDIVYRPGHVGIYVGKSRMIHAPQSGSRVQIAPLGRVIGAGRPD